MQEVLARLPHRATSQLSNFQEWMSGMNEVVTYAMVMLVMTLPSLAAAAAALAFVAFVFV